MKRGDLVRVAALLRRLADDIDQRGAHAWALTRDWSTGPRASTLEAARSRTIGDPTGRAAITQEHDPHAAMVTALDRLTGTALELVQLYRDVGPDRRPECAWHRHAGHHAPATRRHAGEHVCDWCYRRATAGHPPTPDDIRRRATGAERIPRGPR